MYKEIPDCLGPSVKKIYRDYLEQNKDRHHHYTEPAVSFCDKYQQNRKENAFKYADDYTQQRIDHKFEKKSNMLKTILLSLSYFKSFLTKIYIPNITLIALNIESEMIPSKNI